MALAEYSPSLRRQGYRTVEDVTQLTWEDLEDFGILRLGKNPGKAVKNLVKPIGNQ